MNEEGRIGERGGGVLTGPDGSHMTWVVRLSKEEDRSENKDRDGFDRWYYMTMFS